MDGLLARGRPGVLEIPAEEGLADGPAPSGSRPFDVTLLVVPVLVVLGVALLFPTTTRVAARRRREVGGRPEINPANSLLERVSDIYNSVVQSESCMERIACEIGGITSDMGIRETVKIADPFVPSKYKAYFKQFHSGVNCNKIKCGSLAF